MNKFLKSSALGAMIAFGFAAPAQADFVGAYALSNWTQSLGDGVRDGSIALTAPTSVKLTGFDDGGFNLGGNPTSTRFTIAATSAGTVTFSWAYLSNEGNGSLDGPANDPAGYIDFGDNQLTVASPHAQSATGVSFGVSAGEIFGFYVNSLDGSFGSAEFTISDFNFVAAATPPTGNVPEPSSVALLGLGLLGLGVMQKRRNKS